MAPGPSVAVAPRPSATPGRPEREDQVLPDPITCFHDVKAVPKCMEAVLEFRYKEVTKKCCKVMLSLPESCFGVLFPIPFLYHLILKAACKFINK
ncbi:hypothetical protein CARUB_v10019119mg [Capsella rubella]|uniref:Prolamin-like domain-containing protein n=2 Tax=Capsella rubella TaxID=81985 RepID=R0HP62_9BRAS|nr:hypothetical protein CARUB_v10019119mg [Capsella rubella]